jgi:thiol-disulfide isomerase/thioredoxin
MFGRKSATNASGARPAAEAAPRTDQPPAARPLEPAGGVNGLLAGQILDGFNRRPAAAYIQVSLVSTGTEPPGAPVEVAADNQGYFTIQGLQTGKHYQLVARTQDGERKLAGTVWATPPNPRLVIHISEDNVNPKTPALPTAPVWPLPGPKGPAPTWPDEAAPNNDGSPRPAGLGAPIKTNETEPSPTAPVPTRPVRPDQIISVNPQVSRDPAPPPIADPPAEAPPSAAGVTPQVPAPVPSCALTGNTLANFALNDPNGQPWEFRQHRARLTLIDFWGTWCTPCLHAVPHLKVLQDNFGSYGLQVVGIAYEDGPLAEQVQRVNRVRQRYAINYQVLLGAERKSCPVLQQFNVRSYPTLVLVDETGRILWRSQGLDSHHLAELDMLIRQRLGVR